MRSSLACLASLLISSTALAQTTLVAHYRLDETSGTVAADSSGNGNDGVYTSLGVTLGQPGTCPSSTSVDFDGFSGYVEIPSSPSLDGLSSDFTVASWVNLDVVQLMRVFSNQRMGNAGGSWSFGTLPGGNLRFTTLGVQDYDQPSIVGAGVWHHIALVFDANFQAHFYLDGALQGTISGGAPANPPSPGWFIAVLDLTGVMEFFDGQIDDVQVYSGSATDAEILFLFQNPCATLGSTIGTNFCLTVPNSSGSSAVITAAGSTSLADQDVTLMAAGCPANVSGIFFLGTTQTLIPFGDGFRCIALPISRIPPFTFADPAGVAMRPLDFSAPYATANLLPGSVVSFQYWFRDAAAMGSGFTLTNAVEIPFVP